MPRPTARTIAMGCSLPNLIFALSTRRSLRLSEKYQETRPGPRRSSTDAPISTFIPNTKPRSTVLRRPVVAGDDLYFPFTLSSPPGRSSIAQLALA
jgi:hypothetical protein